jgi:hypothetical protein
MQEFIGLTLLMLIPKMQVPECVCYDPATGYAYVSNIVGEGWAEDHVGFITRLAPNGAVDRLYWREGTPQEPLSAPKGMCILNGCLYVADNAKVHRFALRGREAVTLVVDGAERLNDLATDGTAVWASDTKTGNILRISPDLKQVAVVTNLSMANGITFGKGRMYGVSWDLHDIFELDPTGARKPEPLGVAASFVNPDGIEVMEDGSFIVSDFTGNKVCAVSAGGKQVRTVVTATTAADIAVDRKAMRLFVPEFQANQVSVYSLR